MTYTPEGETRERVFRFVRERILAGRSPTVREVQAAMGFSALKTAYQHLENLVAAGRLRREAGQARGYRLPGFAAAIPTLIPLLGQVQAGALTTAIENPDGYLPVLANAEPDELFALRVAGASMIGAGILPGDIAVVRRRPTAESGEIVVAMVGDEATVKRLRLTDGRVELHAENPDFPPLVPPPGAVTILGKVIEIRRML